MRRLRKSVLFLLAFLCLCSPIYSAENDAYPIMSNRDIVETFLMVFDELDIAYQSYVNLYNAVEPLPSELREVSTQLRTVSSESSTQTAILTDMETSLLLTEIAFDGYAVKQRHRMIALTAATVVSLIVAVFGIVL